MTNEREDLHTLASLHGIQLAYHDIAGRLIPAEADSLLAALGALGAPVESMDDVAEALAARREELGSRLIEPVAVAWEGRLDSLLVRLRPGEGGTIACHLDLEGGERRAWTFEVEQLEVVAAPPGAIQAPGPGMSPLRRLVLPEALPPGYHRLGLRVGAAGGGQVGREARAVVIAAPPRAFDGERRALWGAFLPLYALRTRRGWGVGDLTDLGLLAEWTAGLGGGSVATLPLLANFLDEPFEPSPYAPATRLFWNEIYLDPLRLPEAEESAAARRLLESPEVLGEIRALNESPVVDYARVMSLKRLVFEEMAAWFFSHPCGRREDYERYVARRKELADYAAFRAVGDRRGEPWQCWPGRLRAGTLAHADYDEEDFRYHSWVQWSADCQMKAVAEQARRQGSGLYLDLPLGVHGSAFDVWRERDLFAEDASAGAPPDAFFTRGQSWGFPPVRPERLRERGYDHLIACLRHHLAHAGTLRIDHVMQFHRLFWIPRGLDAARGVYLRYPSEELYAVLALESQRHRAMLVGENLGTVPPEVTAAMQRHGILGMYVAQYEMAPGGGGSEREPPESTVASLNTHDMPTFRGFWEGRDVVDLEELGFFDAAQAREELGRRHAQREALVAALPREALPGGERNAFPAVLQDRLDRLACSPARMVLVNLEDLWQEEVPQNVPGTTAERPNWRRKARLAFEEFSILPAVVEPLRRLDRLRRQRQTDSRPGEPS